MLSYCQWEPWVSTSVKFDSRYKNFHKKLNLKMSSAKWRPMCYFCRWLPCRHNYFRSGAKCGPQNPRICTWLQLKSYMQTLDSNNLGKVPESIFPFSSTETTKNASCVWQVLALEQGRMALLFLYSLNGRTSYCKISRSLVAARFGFRPSQSLCNWLAPRQLHCRDACQS